MYSFRNAGQFTKSGYLHNSVGIGATKLTLTVRAVSLEPFRAVTLVGAWSVGAVGIVVTRLFGLAFIDI